MSNTFSLRQRLSRRALPLLLLSLLGFVVMGYHPGYEDDGVYLTAIKARLNPALFHQNSDFFRLQIQASLFDAVIAQFVHITHIPLPWAELFLQFATILTILWATRRIAQHLFPRLSEEWAAVALLSAMLTLPVAGTALNIADQHLHPRNLATALILLAVLEILDRRLWVAVLFLGLTLSLHPIMAALGISFCVVLALTTAQPSELKPRSWQTSAIAAAPLGWLFAPANPTWHQALSSRSYYSLYRWTWYEWLGAIAPLFLFWLLWRVSRAQARKTLNPADDQLARFALAVFAYGVFQQLVAILMLVPPAFERLSPLQPMRFLQLIYVFMALVGGGLLGRYILKARPVLWIVFLVVANGGMFWSQWAFIDEGTHLELPGIVTPNPWLQAFDWISKNTPEDAYFALNPSYLAEPGEGYHSFRALAERSQLSDELKDTAVVIQVPSLASTWKEQQLAQAGFAKFELADFERLKNKFGVDWVLVNYPQTAALDCRWHNQLLAVCRIP
jgi:hypothetical protein